MAPPLLGTSAPVKFRQRATVRSYLNAHYFLTQEDRFLGHWHGGLNTGFFFFLEASCFVVETKEFMEPC